jgi:alkaline phosphatase D
VQRGGASRGDAGDHKGPGYIWTLLFVLCLPSSAWSATVTHIAAGEVTASTAVVWGRCDGAATLRVRYSGDGESETDIGEPVAATHDFAAHVELGGLRPDTTYRYLVRCDDGDQGQAGTLRTAPAPDQATTVRFAWSGDVGGQNTCRDAKSGYAIFDLLRAQHPAFFIALGDMIYADDPCGARGRYNNDQIVGLGHPALELRDFWEVWRYHRSDAAFQKFLASTPILAVWDDHEILNDAGPRHDTLPNNPETHLLVPARQAFLDYQPLGPPASDPTRMYRSIRWGKQVELFVLDTRQYRDANSAVDGAQQPKSLLGAAQRAWLVRQLAASDATWKIVVSSVPISIPTCGPRGCDGWANFGQNTGFENELRTLLAALRTAHVRNMVWLTTDVHFASGFRYTPFGDDRDFQFVEFVAGPLNAGVFPKNDFDLTFGTERLFFYGPLQPAAITSFAELRQWLNFGVIDIDESGALRMQIINGKGAVVAQQDVAPR